MRPNHCISIVLFLLMLFFTSCRQEVDIDYPEFEPLPVINSFIVAGEPVTAHVSIAVGYEGPQLSGCDEATVSLFIDDEFAGIMELQEEGIYFSDSIARPDAKYTLSVDIPGYKTAIGSTNIPPITPLNSFQHINFAGMNEEGVTYPAIEFSFSNTPQDSVYFDSNIILFQNDYIEFADPIYINDSVLLNEGLPLTTFSNNLFRNEQEYTMHINYTSWSASSSDQHGWVTNLYPFIFEFRSVSNEYYHYRRQLYLYETGRFPEFGVSSNAAYPLYSNVENGYGIVAGYSYFATDTIKPAY